MIQGLSVSGEQAAAITMTLEHSPDNRRSFTTSFVTSGSAAGGLLSTAIFIPFVALPQEQLMSWGWRIPVLASLLALVYTPAAGFLADKIGRRTVFVIGAAGAAITTAPYLWAITQGNWPLIFALGIICNGFFYSTANAAWPSFFAEMFPNRVRVSGLAVGTQIGFALSGAIAPIIATALAGTDVTQWVGPAVFAIALGVVATAAALTAKETRPLTLDEINDTKQSEREKAAVAAATVSSPATA